MKNAYKQFMAVMIMLCISSTMFAQSGRTAEQSKLPSNRPIPDKRIMQRKIELMRANAPKQVIPTIHAYPNDVRRPVPKPAINK